MKKLLILDLDETLIHASESKSENCDFIVGPYFVYKRAYLDYFLEFCNIHFKIAIWTSSTEDYALEIVNNIFSSNINLEFIYSRNQCVKKRNLNTDEIEWIKDLRKIKKKYSLSKTIVIDDSPEKLQRQYGNLVKVKAFYSEIDDELVSLEKYLIKLIDVDDIKKIEKRNWKSKI